MIILTLATEKMQLSYLKENAQLKCQCSEILLLVSLRTTKLLREERLQMLKASIINGLVRIPTTLILLLRQNLMHQEHQARVSTPLIMCFMHIGQQFQIMKLLVEEPQQLYNLIRFNGMIQEIILCLRLGTLCKVNHLYHF